MGMRGTDRGYCHNKVLRDHCITMAICGMGIEPHSKQKKKLCKSCNSCKYCDAPSECQTKDYHVKLGKNPAGRKKKKASRRPTKKRRSMKRWKISYVEKVLKPASST